MNFTLEEMAAIYKAAKAMIAADGVVDKREIDFTILELRKLKVVDLKAVDTKANAMEASEMFAILSAMSYDKKKHVSAYLGVIMTVDGNVDEREVALWQLISTLAGFPTMNIKDAILNWAAE